MSQNPKEAFASVMDTIKRHPIVQAVDYMHMKINPFAE